MRSKIKGQKEKKAKKPKTLVLTFAASFKIFFGHFFILAA